MANENGKMVQDLVSLDYMRQTATSIPAKISTLLVRRPGRVAAAMEFYDKAMSSMTFGAMSDRPPLKPGGDPTYATVDDDNDTPRVTYGQACPAFLRARDAALQCLTAYFGGLVPDELLVEAEFEVGGETLNARFKATVDESGRVMDPKYAPQPGVVAPKNAVCLKDAIPKKPSFEPSPIGTPMLMPDKSLVYLPIGHDPKDVAMIEEIVDPATAHSTARATMKDGKTVRFDPRTGILLAFPTE